jgi:magnesium-transporting ATPase (P-type)
VSDDAVGRFTRLSSNSRYYVNRFQNFFLIAVLINTIEAVAVVAIMLTNRPTVSSPYFYVPISILGATIVAFLILATIFAVPFFRSAANDVRRRKQRVPER